MKKNKAERRGRKPGVLKELDPNAHPLEKAVKLAYDRTAGDPVSRMVRTWRNLRCVHQSLAGWAGRLGAKQIAAAKTKAARAYLDEKQKFDSWLGRERDKMVEALLRALTMGRADADWFRRVAAAIEVEENDQDPYPRHTALISIFYPGLEIHRSSVLRSEPVVFPDKSPEPEKHTISEVCALLKAKGIKPVSRKDEAEDLEGWKRTIREDCALLGLKLSWSKPGPKMS